METRRCRDLHFIAAIKSGSVTKLPNVNSCGNPALKFKSLKDVYEYEDAKRISSKSAVGHNKVKTEASCLPEVDRTSFKEDFGSSDFVNNNIIDLSDDSNMTLSQLKKIWRGKKRKRSSGSHLNDANHLYDNLQIGEDGLDLKEPLIHWKNKLSKKLPKVKRERSSGRAIKSELALSVKLELIHDFESDRFANRDLSLVCVKREDPESDSFEVPSPISFVDVVKRGDPESDSFEVPSPISFVDVVEPNFDTEIPDEVLEGHAYKNQELVLYRDEYQEYFPYSSEDIEVDGCDSFQQVLCIVENHNCVLNEVCYDHLEPIPLVEVNAGDIVYVSDEMMSFPPCDVSPLPESDTNDKSDNLFSGSTHEFVTPLKDQICHVSGILNDSRVMMETAGQSCSSSRVKLLDTAVNNEIVLIDSPPRAAQTESFSLQQSASSLDSHAYSSPEDESVSTNDGTTEMDQSQACSSTDTTQNCWSPRNSILSDSPTTNEKQLPEMVSKDSKCVSSSRTAIFLDDDTLSAPVVQNSGRLTRKIIPPTSQERLSLAMNCVELHNDADEYSCKEKLFFTEENKINQSIARSNIETARRDENTAQSGQLNRRKVFMNPSKILHKAKNGKRGSPPKRNLDKTCYPRSLPCINTGCTSVKSCSKSAIAFSQQQMHDIDSLAGKLLNELKSMKDIVEQKLLLNSCRNLTLRNDADEVVAAIKTATKAEENAKRLLSVMARDSNRFCKIMSLTQDGPSTPENEIPRKRRKIVFADEAGETLRHVKFFENGSTSMGSPVQKLDNQNENALN